MGLPIAIQSNYRIFAYCSLIEGASRISIEMVFSQVQNTQFWFVGDFYALYAYTYSCPKCEFAAHNKDINR